MKLDKVLFDSVSSEAKTSLRLRMACDMRSTPADNSQRMLNAIEPGTELPIHRRISSSESCIILRGRAEEIFYNKDGEITERVKMQTGSECVGVHRKRTLA